MKEGLEHMKNNPGKDMIKSLRNLASIGEYYERGLKMLKLLSSMLEESPF